MAEEKIVFPSSGKSSWPELVFVKSSVAVHWIERDRPDVKPVVLLAGSPVTEDLRPNRVRIFVNMNDRVVEVPRTG
ncbi:inhibitor of trypsin and hageman factor [Cucumis sativus]|uniref:Uncharacterized protein n=1 Tax=Cucumis sativus TaxID=3659 RepID=A0A0A0KPI0_CUCSA|nr:inhibitor of trypsin and hageman factor [Cucumis sativus]KGN49621.1 hypothetical protein Csa_018430 [Cucumis sativus]